MQRRDPLECFLDVAEIFTFCGHACGGERAADLLNGPGSSALPPVSFLCVQMEACSKGTDLKMVFQ